MSSHKFRSRQGTGWLLVVSQFGLLLALAAMAAGSTSGERWPLSSLALLAASGALGGWTLLYNRFGNFNIHPQPRRGGQLVTTGPYRYMRHPMYSAVLLLAAALACWAATVLAALAWLALLGVLWLKSGLEERWLCERYPDYVAYRARCTRFVPWLW